MTIYKINDSEYNFTYTATNGAANTRQGGGQLSGFASASQFDGAFAVDTSAYKAYFAGNGQWNEMLSGTSSIDALSDVDTTTQAPSSGQALVWNAGASAFRPTTILNNVSDDTSPTLGGNLATGSNNITGSGNIDLQGGGSKLKFNLNDEELLKEVEFHNKKIEIFFQRRSRLIC